MIPISKPDLGILEREYLLDAFDSGWVSSRGPYVERAEELIRAVTGAGYASVVSNGTTALHLALLTVGLEPGDEVIIPSSTYVATLNAVLYVNATPVIVDVTADSWCLDPERVAAAITPRTRAIIAVDLYGHPADYAALRRISGTHGIVLIADAAESLGGKVNGTSVGSLADLTTFSFFGNKLATSGEGGAITSQSHVVNEQVRQLRNQGNHPTRRYYHEVLGYNYRMTNISAAILTAQLERLPELLGKRNAVITWYAEALAGFSGIRIQYTSSESEASPWMFSLVMPALSVRDRDGLVDVLKRSGIETRPTFNTLQTMPYLETAHFHPTPVADLIARAGLSLPTYPALTEGDVHYIVGALGRALGQSGQ